jgi:flagellar motor switch protein FliN/FliY
MSESSVAATIEPGDGFTADIGGALGAAGAAESSTAAIPAPAEPSRTAARKRGTKADEGDAARALAAASGSDRLDLLSNVEMDVTAELGRTRMTVRELLSLTPGLVVELDRMAGSPIDLFVNGTLIGRGEVVVIDEEFGVRITEIVGPGAENSR